MAVLVLALLALIVIGVVIGVRLTRADAPSSPGTDLVTVTGPPPHALLDAPGWMVREALDRTGDVRTSAIGPLPWTWSVDHERLASVGGATLSFSVRLTGHSVDLDTYRSTMERYGVTFTSVATAMGPALVGTTNENGARPTIVAVPLGSGTLELLSYDLSGEGLIALLPPRVVDDAEWRAASTSAR